jgi:protein TonB
MNRSVMDTRAWREHGTALGIAVALHVGLGYVLFNLSHTPDMPPVPAAVIKTQLVSLPAPVVAPALPEPVLSEAVVPEPPVPSPAKPAPTVQKPKVDEAALALKRMQQAKREREQQLEQELQQRQQAERQAQLAREMQARLQQERQAQAQQAAAAKASADAQAASQQYLPIAKEAPDYPQRALERNIEGECTVVYTVSNQGRVTDPQVVGNCHPLFVKPSLAAAKRFRYQPKLIDGQAVAVANVKNTFTYRIR